MTQDSSSVDTIQVICKKKKKNTILCQAKDLFEFWLLQLKFEGKIKTQKS